MANVAYTDSDAAESTKPNYVTYDIYNWQIIAYGGCASTDPDTGSCTSWYPDTYDWVYGGSGSTGAKVTGKVSVPAGRVYVNGKLIATSGAATVDTWVADPPVPSNTSTTQYRNISPGTSGSGSGSVSSGNSLRVYAGTNSVAVVGSNVTTSVGSSTTLTVGSPNVFVGG